MCSLGQPQLFAQNTSHASRTQPRRKPGCDPGSRDQRAAYLPLGPGSPRCALRPGNVVFGIYPPHTHRPLQVGARGSAPHFSMCIKYKRHMRAGGPRSNFVGCVQIYPTPPKPAHTSPRRTREISKSSETLECAARNRRGDGRCGAQASHSKFKLGECERAERYDAPFAQRAKRASVHMPAQHGRVHDLIFREIDARDTGSWLRN